MVIMAVAVGWFAAWFRPAGMARTMLGVAVMQLAVGTLIATAPVTAEVPGETLKALAFSGFFALLWLTSPRSSAPPRRAITHGPNSGRHFVVAATPPPSVVRALSPRSGRRLPP
jgi:hypothetical protein